MDFSQNGLSSDGVGGEMQADGRCRRGRDSQAMSVVWLSEGVRAEQGLEIGREAAMVMVWQETTV